MKRLVILTVILLLGLLPATAREYAVSGPEGGLAIKVALPDGFDPGSVIKQACQGGKFFNARFDPADPPAFIRCWGTPPSNWTSTAPPPPTRAPSCSCMEPKTPSSPCGAARNTWKPMAPAPPW